MWIGWYKGSKFSPAVFERPNLLDGYDWKDWKENKWKIPVARKHYELDGRVSAGVALPTFLGLDPSGKLATKGVQTKYEALWLLACQCVENRLAAFAEASAKNEDTYTYSVGELTDVCDVVIGTNYRLSHRELRIMEILTDETGVAIMQLVIDEPGRIELQKKILQGIGTT